MPDDIIKTREEVADEATPETNEQAVEQRADDYEGLKRIIEARFDELAAKLDEMMGKVEEAKEAADADLVESGAIIIGGDEPELEEAIEDEAADEAVEAILAGEISLEDLMTEDKED